MVAIRYFSHLVVTVKYSDGIYTKFDFDITVIFEKNQQYYGDLKPFTPPHIGPFKKYVTRNIESFDPLPHITFSHHSP